MTPRRFLTMLALVGTALSTQPTRVQAQAPVSGAFCYLDQGVFGGPIQPIQGGWQWTVACAYLGSDSSKNVISGIQVNTVDGDTLATIAQKLANGVKADGATRNFSIVRVVLPQVVQITPQ